ncbi:VOC family protein [Streptomyces luomodiensis]|uniref:VOC family protein n=1 Tax=Streptomyces luomodiensis TaxID=3026192 RepID=A0ABY9V0N8_9ACTN|nr:VOC family protein [Streptomyces sp. SCA4-21]WNE98338.1 VOC family protein [Streptomyces sp. SCA4-21]
MTPPPAAQVHHIGVETFDLANSLSWYEDYFDCRRTWIAEELSELTRSRLPHVTRIAEVAVGDLRFHLLERGDRGGPRQAGGPSEFQHVCLSAQTVADLGRWRDRWLELHRSGRYAFTRSDPPTEIVTDAEGVRSFYCFDVNGLEFEFTHVPESAR